MATLQRQFLCSKISLQDCICNWMFLCLELIFFCVASFLGLRWNTTEQCVLLEWAIAMSAFNSKFAAALQLESMVSGGKTSLLGLVNEAWLGWWAGHITVIAVTVSVLCPTKTKNEEKTSKGRTEKKQEKTKKGDFPYLWPVNLMADIAKTVVVFGVLRLWFFYFPCVSDRIKMPRTKAAIRKLKDDISASVLVFQFRRYIHHHNYTLLCLPNAQWWQHMAQHRLSIWTWNYPVLSEYTM